MLPTTSPPIATTSAGAGEAAAGLTGLLARTVSRHRLHHGLMAVADTDGRRHWSAAIGTATSNAEPADTPFFTASITKRFIVTLVLQAQERGELDLDGSITGYLPARVTASLHRLRGRDHTGSITVRHLATHTSGLANFLERRRGGPGLLSELRAGRDFSWTFEDMLRINRDQQHPAFPPQDLSARHQKARYSDTGFQLLIRILEEATSAPYRDLLRTRITEPLGLTRTWHPAGSPADPATPEPLPLAIRDRPVDLPRFLMVDDDVYSTASDLIRFERALLAGRPFRRPETAGLLTERRNRLRNAPQISYGMGTMFFPVNRLIAPGRRPVTLIGHSGSSGSWLFTCPELGVQLAGTVDQTQARVLPFRVMASCLRIWQR